MADGEPDDEGMSPEPDPDPLTPSFIQQLQQTIPLSSQLPFGGFGLQSSHEGTDVEVLDYVVDDFEQNRDVATLLEYWTISYGMKDSGFPPIGDQALRIKEWRRPNQVFNTDLDGDLCDPQGINWGRLGTTRENARAVRNKLYVNYTNIKQACPSEVSKSREQWARFQSELIWAGAVRAGSRGVRQLLPLLSNGYATYPLSVALSATEPLVRDIQE